MRLITGFLLGGALAAGALGVAVSQTRPGATGGPTTGQAAAPAGINRVNDVLKLMQQAADAAAKAKAAQTRADAAKALADKAEADRRAADAAAGAGATAAQLDAEKPPKPGPKPSARPRLPPGPRPNASWPTPGPSASLGAGSTGSRRLAPPGPATASAWRPISTALRSTRPRSRSCCPPTPSCWPGRGSTRSATTTRSPPTHRARGCR
jgi:hypothetical protein